MPEAAVIALAFFAVALACYAVLGMLFSDERRVTRRLSTLTTYEHGEVLQTQPLLKSFADRVLRPAVALMIAGAKRVLPGHYRVVIDRLIVSAGQPQGLTGERFLVAQTLIAVGVFVLLLVAGLSAGRTAFVSMLMATVSALACGWLPVLWLRDRAHGRQRAIVRELPDLLDMLTISVEAGLGLDGALAKIVRSTHGPLAKEFARMLQEVQAGATRKEAMRNLARRIDAPEINSFVTSVVQAEVFGVSIVNVLRTQADEMRLKRRQQAEEQAQRTPVQMALPLVLCILPATMVVIMGPAVVRIGQLFGMAL